MKRKHMKQVVGTKRENACPSGCTMLQITESLWLCPHKAWGWSSNLKGAEAEARKLMEAAGGYDSLVNHGARIPSAEVQSSFE